MSGWLDDFDPFAGNTMAALPEDTSLPMFATTSDPVAGASAAAPAAAGTSGGGTGGGFLSDVGAAISHLFNPSAGAAARGPEAGAAEQALGLPAPGTPGNPDPKPWTQKAADALLKLGAAGAKGQEHNPAPVQARLDLAPRSAQSQAFRGQSSLGSLVQALLQRQAQYGPPGTGGGGGGGRGGLLGF
jgi:hypothetical protein